jgi:hypothetical protein
MLPILPQWADGVRSSCEHAAVSRGHAHECLQDVARFDNEHVARWLSVNKQLKRACCARQNVLVLLAVHSVLWCGGLCCRELR